MDPLRKILMTNNGPKYRNKQQADLITVEEGIDCREANSRFFSLLNHESRLNIIISKNCSFISCKLAGHEIVIDQRQYNQLHETWAISDRPYQRMSSLPWNCHVRGGELLLSTSNNSSSIMYELTKFNELNSLVKLKSIHLQHQVTYFNLNNAKEKVPVDGHTLVVQCNGNMSRIQVQNTKLLCQCNRKASILAQSLIGDIPFELVRHDASISSNTCNQQQQQQPNIPTNSGNDDDLIVCDSIFSIEATCPLDCLRVKLQYNERSLLFEARSTAQSSLPTSSNNVTSSTQKGAKLFQTNNKINNNDLHHQPNHQTQQASSSSNEPPSISGDLQADSNADFKFQDNQWLSSLMDSGQQCCLAQSTRQQQPTTTYGVAGGQKGQLDTSTNDQPVPQLPTSLSSSTPQHPATILRARVRVTNFGVCIMPLMMTNYACTYRFTW